MVKKKYSVGMQASVVEEMTIKSRLDIDAVLKDIKKTLSEGKTEQQAIIAVNKKYGNIVTSKRGKRDFPERLCLSVFNSSDGISYISLH